MRRRDADFPSAPIHVTGAAQVKIIGISTARPSESSRAERNGLPVRPSTSGGPAPNNSKRKGAEKRETKDDLHFNSLRAHGSGTTVYDFPLPGSLLTPSNPPKSHPPIRTSSLPCADTHDQMGPTAAKLGVPPMKIGMTLGSPTHQPANWQSQAQIMYSARNATPDSVDTYVDYDVHVAGPLKQKSSKWKLFGGLFGATKKNQGGSPQTFYQLQPEEVVVKNTTDADYMDFGEPVSLGNQRPSKSKGWGRTNSQRNVKKQKPDLRRAQTAPLNFDVQDSTRGRIVTRAPEITLDRGPLLDVNIPSVEMERYSVMFGGLLQNTPGTTSSLLTRRQATLDRLKTVNEALALKVSPNTDLLCIRRSNGNGTGARIGGKSKAIQGKAGHFASTDEKSSILTVPKYSKADCPRWLSISLPPLTTSPLQHISSGSFSKPFHFRSRTRKRDTRCTNGTRASSSRGH